MQDAQHDQVVGIDDVNQNERRVRDDDLSGFRNAAGVAQKRYSQSRASTSPMRCTHDLTPCAVPHTELKLVLKAAAIGRRRLAMASYALRHHFSGARTPA
jgi:hypothetical protein